MSKHRDWFFRHVCQTSPEPLGLEVVRAEGAYLFTADGRKYLDLISGIGVANIGHGRPEVLHAIEEQARAYLHPMVYGELIMAPQVTYAHRLADLLPGDLDTIYFVNSGAEAVEGALKTARKFTGRAKIYSFHGCYHGDTFGAMTCQSERLFKFSFEPLVPEIESLPWNEVQALQRIDTGTAAVIIEPIQAEAGVRIPSADFMLALRQRCREVGALLIFDEVMTGFGRTGKLFAAEHWGIAPDIMVLAKALGGGLPLGAFAGTPEIMQTLSTDPPLCHVTTFGGNPLSCAAGLAALDVLLEHDLPAQARKIGTAFSRGLQDIAATTGIIDAVRNKGALIGVDFVSPAMTRLFVQRCLDEGVIVGWTLFYSNILRMAPPLILSDAEIAAALDRMQSIAAELAN